MWASQYLFWSEPYLNMCSMCEETAGRRKQPEPELSAVFLQLSMSSVSPAKLSAMRHYYYPYSILMPAVLW